MSVKVGKMLGDPTPVVCRASESVDIAKCANVVSILG